ncbi:FecR domain-containing protein [Pandoraea sp. NPDC087047]|uniref:FecR domain-containing protein n=1 Tax=Pandoraea sp. NPDC087047 TaxID=3364390 RepID=UPI0037FA4EAF
MARPNAGVIEQAAVWMTTFQSGEATAADEAACARWRAADPAHENAWQMMLDIDGRIRDGMAGVSPVLARSVLRKDGEDRPRRRALKSLAGLGALALLGGGTWVISGPGTYDRLTADKSTGPGERRTITLADGTVVTLNTATAIDIAFDERARRIRLRGGEIEVRTAKDPLGRPFLVNTRLGQIMPIGTRFVVRDVADRADAITVGVTEGAVRISPISSAQTIRLSASEQASFSATGIDAVAPLDPSSNSWLDGMLIAHRMPLPAFIAELSRYRRGVLRCDPSLGTLRVSGAFPLDDTDTALALLEKVVPVRTRAITPYWVTVVPR